MKVNIPAIRYFFLLFLPKYCLPKYFANNINEIDIKQLQSDGIKGIIFDLDQTLALSNQFVIYPPYLKTYNEISNKFKVCALTNQGLNLSPEESFQRSMKFESEYNLRVLLPEKKKPDPTAFKTALVYLSLPKEQVIFIGDRILTDIIGSNLVKISSIYVKPINIMKEPLVNRVIIRFETFILKIFKKIFNK